MLAKLHPARKEACLWAVVVFASVLAAIGIALLAPRMAPIQEGDAATFWRYAAGVQLVNDAADDRGGYAYFIDDAWCAYESPHWHGSKLHRVPRKAVTEQLSVVVSKLEWKILSGDEDAVTRGYRRWREQSEPEQTDATLHQAIEGERWRDLAAADIDG